MRELAIRFIRKPEILTKVGLSNATLYNRINRGLFPPPINLGGRSVGWISAEINVIMSALIAQKSESELKNIVAELIDKRKTYID